MRKSRSAWVLCVWVLAVGSCAGRAPFLNASAGAPLVPLRQARISVLPFAYRSYLPFEHQGGKELAQAVRAALAQRVPSGASFVEGARVEGYLRSTPPEQVDRGRIAAVLDVHVLVMGSIRYVEAREAPTPGTYAALGIVDVDVYDARAEKLALRERLKVRLPADELAPTVAPPSRVALREMLTERMADRIASLIMSPEMPPHAVPDTSRKEPTSQVRGEPE